MKAILTRPTPRYDRSRNAFTRLEVFVCLGAAGLLVLVASPSLAGLKSSSDRSVCAYNMSVIGRGFYQWIGDSANHVPPWWVPPSGGGTFINPRAPNGYYEWSALSNEIVHPKVFACPADTGVLNAPDWYSYRFVYQQAAMSYATDVHAENPVYNGDNAWIIADRNIHLAPGTSTCAAGFNNIRAMDSELEWTNSIHGQIGNLLLIDGSVEFASSERFRSLSFAGTDRRLIHVLKAR